MKKSELIFGQLVNRPNFMKDLEFSLNLSQDDLQSILDVYLKSKYRTYYHDNLKKFAKKINLSVDEALKVVHVLDYFAYRIVSEHEIKDILSALDEIGLKKSDKLVNFLQTLKKAKKTLEILDLIDDEVGTINPHFHNLTFNIQNRIVLKDNKVIENLPIVLLQINTSQNDSDNIIELLNDDLDSLIDGLNEIKKKLNILKEGDKNESSHKID